ncbi:hypothetical protein HMPREF3150_05635 [Pseudomonas aeruginosa]|nr:hypothetical protein HMPREF3150_05635 [Pseudomonas aeruginosa]
MPVFHGSFNQSHPMADCYPCLILKRKITSELSKKLRSVVQLFAQ